MDEPGDLRRLGSYRFDDPAGEVGIEFLVYSDGPMLLHLPFSYRGEPLEGAESRLVGTAAHSVLGTRYIYDGLTDPVLIRALVTAILTGGEQARIVRHDGETVTEVPPTVLARSSGSRSPDEVPAITSTEEIRVEREEGVAVVHATDLRIDIVRVVGAGEVRGDDTLLVSWDDGQALLAAVALPDRWPVTAGSR